MKKILGILVCAIVLITIFVNYAEAEVIIKKIDSEHWTSEPYTAGFSVLEALSGGVTYGGNYPDLGYAYFPKNPIKGNVTIPVFMVDWNDFNPSVNPSNPNNPNSIVPNYTKHTKEEISSYLNGTHGPAEYFREISGGQLNITFDVLSWMDSNAVSFLNNRSTYYSSSLGWAPQTVYMTQDVLRSAIGDWNMDLKAYDKDNNQALDGFVILYEGLASPLTGTNLATHSVYYMSGPPPAIGMFNLASLVPTTSSYYPKFQTQQLLYDRFINMPEVNPVNDLVDVSTWTHELGHLLLGYQDYYYEPTSLGLFALSAGAGHPTPLHMSGIEKWLFGKWINPVQITSSGTYTLTNHHLKSGQIYSTNNTYLYKILINNDPRHYLLIENRNYLPRSQGGSFFNEQAAVGSSDYFVLESGLYIFEVNENIQSSEQIKLIKPSRVTDSDPLRYYKGAFQPTDRLDFPSGSSMITVKNISTAGETVTFTLDIASSQQPDLTISAISATTIPVAKGSEISISTTVKNLGTATAEASVIDFHLSLDPIYGGANDTALTQTRLIPQLAVNTSSTGSVSVTIPTTITEGTYYICASADSTNIITESNETNQSVCSKAIQVKSGDLIVTTLNGAGMAIYGKNLIFNKVKNQGLGTLSSSSIGFYISTDNIITTADTLVGTRSIASLAPGTENVATTTLNISSTIAPGTYYWGAIADYLQKRYESDESNNTQVGGMVIINSGVDLVPLSMTVPDSLVTGSSIIITSNIKNQSIGASKNSYLGIYLSNDNIITTTDLRIGTQAMGIITPLGTNIVNVPALIPTNLATGAYYLGAIADYSNLNLEINETNNIFAGPTRNILPGTDLIIKSISSPVTGSSGMTLSTVSTVKNQGLGKSASFYIGIYLSKDTIIDKKDTFLGNRRIPTLEAGQEDSATVNFIIPANLIPGDYYIGAIADYTGVQYESVETNNYLTGNLVKIGSAVDLNISSIDGPDDATKGSVIKVSTTANNSGLVNSANFYVGIYLSTDANITTSDKYLGNRYIPSLVAQGTNASSTNITIPTTTVPGNYYLGAIADYQNYRFESNETNNSKTGNYIIIR